MNRKSNFENSVSNESIREVDAMINSENISKNDITFNTKQLLSTDSIIDENSSTNNQSTIYTAIENFIESERYMTFGNREKAFICLVRFQAIIQRIIENKVKQTEDYQKHREIYDYYMSDEVQSKTLDKLEFLAKRLQIEYKIIGRDDKHLSTGSGIQKCASFPANMTLASHESREQNTKKSVDIFDINNLFVDKNYGFGSDKYNKLINECIHKQKPSLRKCLSMDMTRNEETNDVFVESIGKNFENKSNESISVSNRVQCFTTGYYSIITPLIAEQTIRKIEEYKQSVELKPKSDNFVYEWQKNRKKYITRALKL